MYDPILAKSFSRNERKRFGYWGFIVILMILFLSSCIMVSKPHLHPLFMIGEVMNLQLSITATQDMFVLNDTTFPRAIAKKEKEVKPICNLLEPRSDYCEMTGDIRILGNSSKIFLVTHDQNMMSTNNSWSIKPYARKDSSAAMTQVKNWTVELVQESENLPKCGAYHGYPAVLFSQGGFSGNHFHDFTDLLVPIFATSHHFNREVHFLATDYKKWWTGKYRMVLSRLSRHKVTEIDKENVVQCFPSITLGLKCHNSELSIDSSKSPNRVSMKNFKNFLRTTFSLPRTKAMRLNKKGDNHGGKRPRLMMISRKKTRVIINEDRVAKTAEDLGYEVVTAEANISTNLSKFAEVVNSCDVVMGVHGAGLTNMVFLPDNGVVIQVIPLGEVDGFARRDFGYPSKDLNVRYLEYKIGVKESSLVDSYPLDHVVFKDPMSIHKKGWMALRSVYLDQQNVRIDVNRFRATLIEALRLLQH